MKRTIFQTVFRAALVLLFGAALFPAEPLAAFTPLTDSDAETAFARLHAAPRLLMTDEIIGEVHRTIEADPVLAAYYEALLRKGEKLRGEEPVRRVLTGIRLLGVSREALNRILTWSFLYRMTGDSGWAGRVETEACAIAAFEDWHPEHFLDVAEMTLAMAIGYDSCKETFAPESRRVVFEAIRDKGVRTAIEKEYWWQNNDANWNQVCWCGALCGALAIADEEPELAEKAFLLAVNGISPSMAAYRPDGTYTEGASYWGYGTGFNCILLAALESAFGTDFGRADSPGFRSTILYYENVFGTTGNAFNYSDCGGGFIFEPAAFWFDHLWNNPEMTRNENRVLHEAYEAATAPEPDLKPMDGAVSSRLAACLLLWVPARSEDTAVAELPNGFVGIGNGRAPVALFRTGWEKTDAFLGIKGGTGRAPHGHMDIGGFVYDDLGIRWFADLGPESYHKIEQLGMNLWDFGQQSDRWKIFRYNNFGHSVPNINGQLQLVDGLCPLTESRIGAPGESSFAEIDLTPAYRGEASSFVRRAVLLPDGSLEITDTLTAFPEKAASVERRFVTPADVTLDEDGNPVLTISGRKKVLLVSGDLPTEIEMIPAGTDREYDAKNDGMTVMCLRTVVDPGKSARMSVKFRNLDDGDDGR